MNYRCLVVVLGCLVLSGMGITITNHRRDQLEREEVGMQVVHRTSPVTYISGADGKQASEGDKVIEETKIQKEKEFEDSSEQSPSESALTDSDGVATPDETITKKLKASHLVKKPLRKSSAKTKQTTKQNLPNQKSYADQQDENNFSVLSIVFIYISSFIAVLFMIKHYRLPDQSTLEVILDLAMLVQRYFQLKRNGYKATPNFSEEIEDLDSVTVGYSGEHGKMLFWEKNSVEGI